MKRELKKSAKELLIYLYRICTESWNLIILYLDGNKTTLLDKISAFEAAEATK